MVSELAAIYRPSASEGERQAAELIAARLERLGCKVTIDEESGTGGYWWSVGTMSAVGTLAGIVALSSQRRRRKAGRRRINSSKRPPFLLSVDSMHDSEAHS